jgi:hypothetical protein
LPLSKADDADRIIATARFLAKHPAMDGMFGPMSGWRAPNGVGSAATNSSGTNLDAAGGPEYPARGAHHR